MSAAGSWARHELFELLPATPAGLTTEGAQRRLRLYGPNSFVHESRFAALLSFFGFFRNPLVVILVIASGVSLALGEHIGGLIILAIVLFSVILNFLMEFQARHAVEDIQKQIALTAAVVRDGRDQELPTAELVPGDIVRLNAGDLVPADARLLEVKDLHVRESVLTGESLPVEKTVADLPKEKHGVACSPSKVKERNPLRRSYHLNTKIPMYLRPQRFEPLGDLFRAGTSHHYGTLPLLVLFGVELSGEVAFSLRPPTPVQV